MPVGFEEKHDKVSREASGDKCVLIGIRLAVELISRLIICFIEFIFNHCLRF